GIELADLAEHVEKIFLVDAAEPLQRGKIAPGSGFEAGVSEAIMPDVVVRASSEGGWLVELNPDKLPRVLVNQSYFSRVTRNGEDHACLS
ncbi:hypothetical protein ACC758_38570, partial [Rhizobium ruizarguesonis]